MGLTLSNSQGTSSLPGWDIEDALRLNGSFDGNASLRIRVRGSIINTAPTGSPTITQEGLTLVADVAAIADADGVENATYEYQWIDVDGMTDTDITNATDRTYTVTAADAGKTIKVKVTFTDDAGSREELTSATKTVQVPPETPANLTARAVAPMQVRLEWDSTLPSPKDIDLEDPFGYRIEWSADGDAPWTSAVNITNQHVSDSDIWCTCYPTRFNDDTIAPGTTRYYRIQAVGEDGAASAWSTAVSATTPGAGGFRRRTDRIWRGGVATRRGQRPEGVPNPLGERGVPLHDQWGGAEAPGGRDRCGRHGDRELRAGGGQRSLTENHGAEHGGSTRSRSRMAGVSATPGAGARRRDGSSSRSSR